MCLRESLTVKNRVPPGFTIDQLINQLTDKNANTRLFVCLCIGTIIGIAVGGCVLLLIVVTCIIIFVRRRHKISKQVTFNIADVNFLLYAVSAPLKLS